MVLIGSVPGIAHAQATSVEIRQYQPTPFSDGYLRLDGTATLPRWKLHAGFDLDYAWKSLVLIDVAPSIQRSRKTTYDFIGHAVGADLTMAMGLGGRFEIGALVPVTVFQTGDNVPGSEARGLAGLENPRIGAKARLLGSGSGAGAGLGAAVLVTLPWGLGGPFIHDTQPAIEGRLFTEMVQERWSVRAGAGYRTRPAVQLFDITLGNELTFAVGAEGKLSSGLGILAELAGATSGTHPLASSKQTPVELLIGGRREVGASWLGGDHRFWLTIAAGPGLTPGYGSPEARAVVSLAWSNRPAPRAAEPPAPPARPPETCPGGPHCPKAPQTPVVSDRDNDGIPDDDDECPDEPEDKDGFEDDDGCPDPDNDKDGILDAADKCPNEPETINGVDDDDGCPDKGDTAVRIGKEELETLKPIFFETDHSRVRHAYYNVLGQIALTLKAHPEIGRCAVEGHTDDTGPPEWNQKLSLLRAEAVVEFLVDKGVERGRLTAIGHGEKLPWAPNDTESGRAQNRRVIFHIEGVDPDEQKRQENRQRIRARKMLHESEAPSPGRRTPVETEDAPEATAPPSSKTPRDKAERAAEAGKTPGKKPGKIDKGTPDQTAPERPAAGKPAARASAKATESPDEPPKFIEPATPGSKKPPRPVKSSSPPTLRDLLRLPER